MLYSLIAMLKGFCRKMFIFRNSKGKILHLELHIEFFNHDRIIILFLTLQNILTEHWHQWHLAYFKQEFSYLIAISFAGRISFLQTNAFEILCPLHDPRMRKWYRRSGLYYPNFDRKGCPSHCTLRSCLPCILTGHFVFWTLAHVFIRKRGRTINESFDTRRNILCGNFGNHGPCSLNICIFTTKSNFTR